LNSYRLKAMWAFTKGSRGHYLLAITAVFMAALFSFVSPQIISVTVDSVLGDKPATIGGAMGEWLNNGGIELLKNNLWLCGIATVVIMLLRSVFMFVRGRSISIASEGVAKRIRDALYDHLQKLPYDYHVKAETGDLIQRATTDVETVRRFLSVQLISTANAIFMLVLAFVLLIRIHVVMTLISLVLVPLIVGFSMVFFKKMQNQFDIVEKADGYMSTVLQENLTGVRVVRAFGREKFETQKFTEANDGFLQKFMKMNILFATFWGSSDFIVMMQQAVSLLAGIWFAARGDITLGQFMVFNSYLGMMLWPIRHFGRVLADMGKSLIAMGRIDEILRTPAETSGPEPKKPPIDRDIVFSHLTFGYSRKKTILSDISFTVKAGETVAILGSTGSGKSTLMALMQRLYDYEEGSATIGGVEIREIDKEYLRSRIGIVLQEPFLYSKNIRDNIGITLREMDEEKVVAAAQVACVHDVITTFDKGYDTIVGERGVTLSGGQKQRVAIARTVLRDCDVLIFDDSLSAVDTETDAQIRAALKQRRKGVTTFIISHRISTLMEADRILVLEGGRLVQQGTHDELVEQEGLYRRVWEIQNAVHSEEEVM